MYNYNIIYIYGLWWIDSFFLDWFIDLFLNELMNAHILWHQLPWGISGGSTATPDCCRSHNNVEAKATRIDVEHGFSIHYVDKKYMSKPCFCQSFPTAKRSKKECHPHVCIYIYTPSIYIYIIIYNVYDICILYDL